jgi:hypothetical protein
MLYAKIPVQAKAHQSKENPLEKLPLGVDFSTQTTSLNEERVVSSLCLL